MQFDNIQEYIDQVYGVELDTAFLNKNVHALTYLKVVRILSHIRIETTGLTAEAIFADAVRLERVTGTDDVQGQKRLTLLFQLADIHAHLEMLIDQAGKRTSGGFDAGVWANDINS